MMKIRSRAMSITSTSTSPIYSFSTLLTLPKPKFGSLSKDSSASTQTKAVCETIFAISLCKLRNSTVKIPPTYSSRKGRLRFRRFKRKRTPSLGCSIRMRWWTKTKCAKAVASQLAFPQSNFTVH
ncbi:hypothetical protein COOONC_03775 [Cooperia oncophora]